MLKLRDKIEEAQKRLSELKSLIAELVGIAEAENRDLSDEETVKLDEASDELTRVKSRIENLEKAEKALGLEAVSPQGKAPALIHHQGYGRERKKGEILFRHATVAFLAHREKKSIEQVANERYAHDPGLIEVVKSAIDPAQTDVSGWAEELVDDTLQGFQDLLRGESIAAGMLGDAGTQLQFDGLGSIRIPARAGADTDMASGFTGESDAIPVRRATLSPIVVAPYKWGAISTFSKELSMRSTPSIESLIRQFILQDTGTKLDNDFFGTAAAVAAVRPAGIFNGVAGVAGSATTALADRITEDLIALVSPILTAKMGRRLRICINPLNAFIISQVKDNGKFLFRDEINRGELNMFQVVQSHNVPVSELWAIDMQEVAWAPGTPTFEVNDTATLVMVDDDGVDPEMGADETPRTPSGQVGDAARDAVNNPPIRSLFQTETVAVKMVQYLSWHKMRAGNAHRVHTIDYTS